MTHVTQVVMVRGAGNWDTDAEETKTAAVELRIIRRPWLQPIQRRHQQRRSRRNRLDEQPPSSTSLCPMLRVKDDKQSATLLTFTLKDT